MQRVLADSLKLLSYGEIAGFNACKDGFDSYQGHLFMTISKVSNPKDKLPIVTIQLKIRCCDECPKVDSEHTSGTGFGVDYYCTLISPKKLVMGYIEWDREKKPIPDWCPLKVNKEEENKQVIKEAPFDID